MDMIIFIYNSAKNMEDRKGDYELLEIIGRGSFGVVYKGFAKESGEIVAIKVVDLEDSEEVFEDLQHEIKILSECSNPHVTNFYESFLAENKLYIVMEYLGGGSVKDILRMRGNLQEIYIAIIMRETL
jgi:serine/threonine-protein kinase 24/25/MST4